MLFDHDEDLPPVAKLLEAYLSLERSEKAPLNAFGPPIAYEWWREGRDFEAEILLVQRIMPPAFRAMLADELGLAYVCGVDPLAVPSGSRSPRWQTMCEGLYRIHEMPAIERVAFLALLMSLGYYELVFELSRLSLAELEVPPDVDHALAYASASARYIISINQKSYDPFDLVLVAQRARPGSRAHFLASSRLLMFYGRFRRDSKNGRHWRECNKESLDELGAGTSEFTRAVLASRYWRSASLLPLVEEDLDNAWEEMACAEKYARAVQPTTEQEAVLARANLYPVLQSKARLAQLIGNHDLALLCIEEMCRLDLYYSTAFVDLGHARLAVGDRTTALAAFKRATRLGPPAALIAQFMAEHCED
ncbi:hypothetical protein V5F40_19395 [Xanthobacter sp. DSM 14520]|uniref:hypothetical protein n=1 Tax=Xanthobacter autotrophicus (strain ATCC BAA-1158 / Py2) TaxID=78245 RepID=UPI00372B08BE